MLAGKPGAGLLGCIGLGPAHLGALGGPLAGQTGCDRRDPAGTHVHTHGVGIQPQPVEPVGQQPGHLALGLAARDRGQVLTADFDQ